MSYTGQNDSRSQWISLNGAVVAVAVTLLTIRDGFSLWTSVMGFILLAYMTTFFMNQRADTGTLMKSELFAIGFLFLIAPALELAFFRLGWNKIAVVATANGINHTTSYTAAREESSEMFAFTLREVAFVWMFFFFIYWILYCRIGYQDCSTMARGRGRYLESGTLFVLKLWGL
jgi:hypothetical protein